MQLAENCKIPENYSPLRLKPRRHLIERKPQVAAAGMKQAMYLTAHPESRSRGYHVRIGRLVSLFFGSSRYGSDDNAFEAAVKYRDDVLPLLDEAEYSYMGNFVASRRNKSGYIGVALERGKNGYDGYSAQWNDKETGKHQKKWFAIGKYGKEGALELAIQARNRAAGTYPSEILDQIKAITSRVRLERSKLVVNVKSSAPK